MQTPVIIVGAGLWGGLLAWFLLKRHPRLEFILYEENTNLGGSHTWSFHETDVDLEGLELLRPLIRKSWPSYAVKFPGHERRVELPYHTITSAHFDSVLRAELPEERLRLGRRVSPLAALKETPIVFDARGITPWVRCAHQKFLGLELQTRRPHGLTTPILMDATVEQIEGLRFLYYLPLDDHRILIEDTRYSETSFLDHYRLRQQLLTAASGRGWEVEAILREEHGALPIPFSRPPAADETGVLNLGGIFHDTTGYSLPDAVRLIDRLTRSTFGLKDLRRIITDYRRSREADRRFFCFLNRLMFSASDEAQRYRTMEFFYRGSETSIKKFYRGELTHLDRLKFFLGRPPVQLGRAMDVIFERGGAYESAQ